MQSYLTLRSSVDHTLRLFTALGMLLALLVPTLPTTTGLVHAANSCVTEGFETVTPTNWIVQNKSNPVGTTSWYQGNSTVFAAQSGAATSYVGANYNSTGAAGTISNWLLTPEWAITNGDQLTFYTRIPGGSAEFPDRLQVRLSTNGASSNVGTDENSVGDFTTLLLDINPALTTGVYPKEWTAFTATVSGLGSPTTGRFAFRYFVTDAGANGSNSDYIGIDTVQYHCGTPGYSSDPAPGSSIDVGSSVIHEAVTKDLTISETGDSALQVSSLVLSGANAADFSVSPNSAFSILDGGTSKTVTITCTPSASGPRSTTLTISHNGSDGPASYNLTCAGLAPSIEVSGKGVEIQSGDSTPAFADDSDFGSVATGSSVTHTFTITNSGTSALTLTGTPVVAVSGSGFTVTEQPSSSVAISMSTTFDVTFAPTADGLHSAVISIGNNDDTTNPYTFTVQGEGMTLVAPAITSEVPAGGTYGSTYSHVFTASGAPTPTLSLHGTLPAGLNWDAATATIGGIPSQVGSYPLTASASNGIDPEATQVFTLTIAKAPQTISIGTSAPATATYGSDFTVAATGGGSNNPVTYSSGGACSNNGALFTMTSGTGSCTVTYEQAGDNTYLAAAPQVETVQAVKAPQSISFAPLSDTTYGDPAVVLGAIATSGLDVTYSLDAGDTCLISAGTIVSTGAGDCTVTATQTGDANYASAADVVRNFHTNKAALIVTAEDQIRRVGEEPGTLTVLYSGFVNDDDAEDLDIAPQASTSADASSSVGSYDIVVSGGSDDNYDLQYVNGTLTVTDKYVATVAWDAPAMITYGDSLTDAQLNARATFDEEEVAGSFSYDPPLGTVLDAGDGQVLSVTFTPDDSVNYEVVTQQVQLDVAKAALTVTAEDKTMVAGSTVPVLTVRYSGFVNSDGADDLDSVPVASTIATSGSAAGSYPIVVGRADDANYIVHYVDGTLTVTPGAASVLTVLTGEVQEAQVDSVFTTSFKVHVTDAYGNAVPGVEVTFVAPTEGASGSFTPSTSVASVTAGSGRATVVTDDDGVAASPVFTANNVPGSYSVQAFVDGIAMPVSFHLTNAAKTPTFTTRLFLPVIIVR